MRVLLVSGSSLRSWVIKQATGSVYSHCGLLLPDFTVIEADAGGMFKWNLEEYPLPWEVVEYPCSPAQLATVSQWARVEYQHKHGYDYLQLLGIYVTLVTGCIGFASIANSPNLFTCSEFVVDAMRAIRLQPPAPAAVAVPEHFNSDPRARKVSKSLVTQELETYLTRLPRDHVRR